MARLHPLSKVVNGTPSTTLVMKVPISTFPTVSGLSELSYRSQLLCLYKKFFRLRNMIDADTDNRQAYCDTLKRRFSFDNFNRRRNLLLGIDQPIEKEALIQRIVNTYAFLFNSTVEHEDVQAKQAVVHQLDLPKVYEKRIEKSIVLTMLKMARQMPNEIKLDFNYSWLANVDFLLKNINFDANKKQQRKLIDKCDPSNIGYRDYETSIMRLNESCNLCL